MTLEVFLGGNKQFPASKGYPKKDLIHQPMHWRIQEGGGGLLRRAPPLPLGPISFIFMQFLAKILRNNRFLPQT